MQSSVLVIVSTNILCMGAAETVHKAWCVEYIATYTDIIILQRIDNT